LERHLGTEVATTIGAAYGYNHYGNGYNRYHNGFYGGFFGFPSYWGWGGYPYYGLGGGYYPYYNDSYSYPYYSDYGYNYAPDYSYSAPSYSSAPLGDVNTTTTAPAPQSTINDNAVLIGVRVPENAEVWIDGQKTSKPDRFGNSRRRRWSPAKSLSMTSRPLDGKRQGSGPRPAAELLRRRPLDGQHDGAGPAVARPSSARAQASSSCAEASSASAEAPIICAGALRVTGNTLVPGGDLDQYVVDHGPVPVPQACEWIRQAAYGLQEAHDHQLIHRDIKPSNLLLTSQNQVKLVDFGLARQFSSRLTDPNALLGTVEFMSPEQSRDPSFVGSGADIYGLGATLFFLLTGEPPYTEVRSLSERLRMLQETRPRRLRRLRPDAPAELDALIDRMLDPNPPRRPPWRSPSSTPCSPSPTKPWWRERREARIEDRRLRIEDRCLRFAPAKSTVENRPGRKRTSRLARHRRIIRRFVGYPGGFLTPTSGRSYSYLDRFPGKNGMAETQARLQSPIINALTIERRAWVRYASSCEVSYQNAGALKDAGWPGKVFDISAGGIGLLLRHRFPPGVLCRWS